MATPSKILVSACLLGQKVRYDGRDARPEADLLARLQAEGRVVTLCPEVAAGLPIPRPPAEIRDGRVVEADGTDRTDIYDKGARLALELCRKHGISVAILKENSPSCGSRTVYDGSFSGALIPGSGRTTRLLRLNGIQVFSELEGTAALEAMEG